jgi:DNA-binding beta-propeller fold protein YncE
VLDTRDNQVVDVSVTGQVLKTFGGAGYVKSAFGIAADASGVYVADTYNQRVTKIAKNDGHRIWSQTTGGGASLSRPRGVTVGSDGNVYVADTDHGRIVVVSPTTVRASAPSDRLDRATVTSPAPATSSATAPGDCGSPKPRRRGSST